MQPGRFGRAQRADEIDHRRREIAAVNVGKVMGVAGEIGRADPDPGIGRQVIGPLELRMDHHRAAIVCRRDPQRIEPADRHVDRGIAIGVDKQLPAPGMRLAGQGQPVGLLDDRLAVPRMLARRGALGIGPGEPPGARLGRAIEHEFDPLQFDVPVIAAKLQVTARCQRIDLVPAGNYREIELQPRLRRRAGQKGKFSRLGRAFLHMGIAVAGIGDLRRIERGEALLLGWLRQFGRGQREHRRFEHQPGIAAIGHPGHHAAGRHRGLFGYAESGQRRAVGHQPVHGEMQHDHLVIGQGAVQLGPGDMAALGQLVLIIAPDDHPVARRDPAPRYLILERGEQMGNVAGFGDLRIEQVDPASQLHRQGKVRMGIDEAGQQGAALKIAFSRVLPRYAAGLGERPGEHDRAVALDHGRNGLRPVAVHRHDRSAMPQRCRPGVCCRACPQYCACNQRQPCPAKDHPLVSPIPVLQRA